MKKSLFVLLFVSYLLPSFMYGQSMPDYQPVHSSLIAIDTLVPKKKSGLQNWKLVLNLDSRQSFVRGEIVRMNGLRLGAQYKEKYRLGIGLYNMTAPVVVDRITYANDVITKKLDFKYNTLFADYIFYSNYKWEWSIPIALGAGTGHIDSVSSSTGVSKTINTNDVGIFSIGTSGHYKLLYWAGVGAGVGYRQCLSTNKLVRKTFNSPFYVIKIKIFLGALYNMVFRPERWKAERRKYHDSRSRKTSDKL